MHGRQLAIIAYTALLVLSLALPVLHCFRINKAIEAARPVVMLEDGTYSPTLLPAHILLLRWLGSLSVVLPVVVFTALMLSLSRKRFARLSTVCLIAVCQCAFTTFYALYAALVLVMEWTLHR